MLDDIFNITETSFVVLHSASNVLSSFTICRTLNLMKMQEYCDATNKIKK